MDRIYVQTNDADRNEIVAFDRAPDGAIEPIGRFDTGGQGTGVPHLASQSSVALNGDGSLLLVANAGSDSSRSSPSGTSGCSSRAVFRPAAACRRAWVCTARSPTC
jgi:6-phosphogluconolactonase (cycloisomerase 2 family)